MNENEKSQGHRFGSNDCRQTNKGRDSFLLKNQNQNSFIESAYIALCDTKKGKKIVPTAFRPKTCEYQNHDIEDTNVFVPSIYHDYR